MEIAVKSVQRQTVSDFELFIICDGAPNNTVETAYRLAAMDHRIRVFVHDKGPRNGESYRDEALKIANGRYICHICDDDLWLSNHLEETEKFLDENDFGHTMRMVYRPGGKTIASLFDLSLDSQKAKLCKSNRGFFGLTNGVFRKSAYNKLAEGWSAAPISVPSDLHMWRKFIECPGLKIGTRFSITSLALETPYRLSWDIKSRAVEMAHCFQLIQDPARLDQLIQNALRAGIAELLDADPNEFLPSTDKAHENGRGRLPDARLLHRIANFDGQRYLRLNPDVAHARVNPFEHFIRHGLREGRPF